MIPTTPDLCDSFADAVRVLEPIFQSYGGHARFHGQIVTLKLFEDNSLVRQTLGENGQGKVLVVDGGGSRRCALLGDQLGELAVRNGWAGLVIDGCVRDSAALGQLPLGVKALAAHPRKSVKLGGGQRDLPVRIAGCELAPGQWLYADEDGVIVAERQLA
ncbi:ribonuclease E activity regulator RraA [Chromobacterium subtsugae]|uniref:4-hydroxy-4-methyl-2-oxoglutarate aldolase n=1 Tax=Chromobacterium subtsugae TaxID=251747 RepID=A0ABS7FDC2_9NEIS|nr:MULTISPECIES: ribonuclease E activity regulator RraA [Chromobacterium]KUM03912.1 ribonuclease activity regulator protein RraA [Chromobacterium subtsugae]KZE85575.1 ribonuclease activity regulator protein RraA [Chromobacterium sp. F49]MBW7566168.1 ribonuclease E activity regulator RraA [Chromobacterium subtsugae]MBW8287289.1 ribonuclease E activity regulator RraA [Chromobacterium subtsugae]OBU87445.1 ribonuclease activity regulator protein RraA [Chromobacterium subtsugae]